MPAWVQEGFGSYRKRLPRHIELQLEELPLGSRSGRRGPEAVEREGERMLRHLKTASCIVALDERGESWSSRELAQRLDGWLQEQPQVHFLIGGPDGLAAECLQRAHTRWSLSRLTLPHGLVRVIVAEQLYRAWTLLSGHPYHRD